MRDLAVVVVFAASFLLQSLAPLAGVDYPLPDFLLYFLVGGDWRELIFP